MTGGNDIREGGTENSAYLEDLFMVEQCKPILVGLGQMFVRIHDKGIFNELNEHRGKMISTTGGVNGLKIVMGQGSAESFTVQGAVGSTSTDAMIPDSHGWEDELGDFLDGLLVPEEIGNASVVGLIDGFGALLVRIRNHRDLGGGRDFLLARRKRR
jgi:hypothetical protein